MWLDTCIHETPNRPRSQTDPELYQTQRRLLVLVHLPIAVVFCYLGDIKAWLQACSTAVYNNNPQTVDTVPVDQMASRKGKGGDMHAREFEKTTQDELDDILNR